MELKRKSEQEIIDKLNQIIVDESNKWLEDANYRFENKAWLSVSQKIAFVFLVKLRELNWFKEYLAEQLKVTIETINQLIKGSLNIEISLLIKLEEILNIKFLTNLTKWKIK
jgi:nuclear transport factor 2 (NTF2) superfamily protein